MPTLRWAPDRCQHLTAADHSALAHTGIRIWRCSVCGRSGPWTESWRYHGNVECTNCWQAQIDYVLCSGQCQRFLNRALGIEIC